ESLAPVAGDVDLLHHATPAVTVIVGHEGIDQGFTRHLLHGRVKRGAHRQTAAVKLTLAEQVDDAAPHFLREIFRGCDLGARGALSHVERLGPGHGPLLPRYRATS